MGENLKLTAIILAPVNPEFDEQYRALTIKEGERFTVGIKEYEDGKKDLQKKIDDLEKEKNTIDSNLTTKEEQLFQQAKERYSEGGKWLDPKKHNGKIISQAEETYKANLDQERAKAQKLKGDKDILIKKLKDDLKSLEATFDSVVWAWNLARNRSSKPSGRLKFGKGQRERTIIMDKLSSGGGFSWIEPFFENDKPTGSIKNGLYYHSIPQEPDAIIAEWYGVDESENFVKIDQPVAPGSKVQLHIYTKDLYGQNIGVELKANGKTLKANTYSPIIYSKPAKDKESEKKRPKYDTYESEDIFLTEVEIYDYSDPSSIQPPAVAIKGSLTDTKDDFSDGSPTSLPNVQKGILNFYIDPIWSFGVPEIIIKPTIHFLGKNKELSAELKINGHKNPEIRIPNTGNMPVFVDNVETDFRAFHHCRYDLIKGSYAKLDERDENEPVEVIIFDSTKVGSEMSELFMPVIAGNKQGRRNLKITTDAKTEECNFSDNKSKSHSHKVFDLSLIQEAVVVEESTKVDEHLIFSKNDFKIGNINFGKEEEGHKDTNDDNEINATHSKGKGGINGPVGISRTSKTTTFKDERKIGKYANSDTEIVLDVGYQYEGSLIKYIWPTRKAIIQNYPVLLHTCAYPQKTLNIQVYPDIKWILQFAYDCDPEEFNEMRGDAYDKYLVKVEKLDSKYQPEKIEDKISRIDSDLQNAKETKKFGNRSQKRSAEKLISNLEERKTKQQTKANKYIKESSKAKKQYKKDRPDLFNFKDNISSGLSDLVLSLNVEYDRPGEALEISASYQRYIDLVKQIIEVKNTIELILDGKKKSKKKLDKKYKEIDEKTASENLEKLGDALKGRPLFSFDIIPPSLAVLGSWYAESPKDVNTDKVGIVGEIQVMAKPFIGAAITMDFLALAQKAHPIARGIITVIDVADAVGIGPKITLEMEVSGELEIEGKFMYNSASGNTNFNQGSLSQDSEDDSPLTVSGVFKLELRGKIEFSKKANSYIFGSVTAYANAGFEVKTGLTLSGAIKADEKGFFIDPLLTFHGLIVSGIAEAGYRAENSDGGEYFSDSIEGSFELVLMHEYEGSFENSKGEKVQLYLT
ncbi:hypothetical protein [Chryseobacterium shigense]|uniref:Uncharacterized protein n=1 Tax=Chryseobacterium shigense TaxID=297244 RepID=A0A841NFH9_9FLAO|nr:hypothetical protein [Chryseobacterium shigense]MBB6370069.1 hypothetical protein [Chryseobacterium shigense]